MPDSPPPETLAGLRQSAAVNGAAYSQVLLQLLERVEALEQRPIPGFVELAAPAPEPAPVVTDEQILAMRSWSSHGPTFDSDLVEFGRNCYDLGRQHGAAQPTPPAALSNALIRAECALSDIAEGEETNAAPNTFEWAEQRCAETLATIRPVMQQHKIRTSEWPPVSQCTPAAESAADRVLVNCPETCWVEIRRIADGKVIYSNHRRGELTIPVGEPPAAPAAPAAPAGGLAHRLACELAKEMSERRVGPGTECTPIALAAIREVAAWLDRYGCHGCSLWLREEIDRA